VQQFLDQNREQIVGVLEGYDRLLFRGSLQSISYTQGLDKFLGAHGIRYTEFGSFAEGLTKRLLDHAEQIAQAAGRPNEYLASPSIRKDQKVNQMAEKDGVTDGLICVLRCVEPCKSYSIRRLATGKIDFVRRESRCTYLYFYYMDRQFGLMHIRMQTWLPFDIQVCLNGREYLARQMKQSGIGYEQRENCFVRIDDLPKAQELMRQLEERNWAPMLSSMARHVNPLVKELNLWSYYWSVRESEYATDVMFKDQQSLDRLYPALVDHAIGQFSSQDTMRFLGRRTSSRFNGEASTNIRRRAEGIRIKHWLEENSIKMYNKQGSVLRIETTLNNVRQFKVRRCRLRSGRREMCWIPMRKGIVDLPRRTDIGRAANGRYLEALGVVGVPSPTRQLLDPVSRRIVRKRRPYRALRPVSVEETQIFQIVMDGRYQLRGFKNADIRCRLKMDQTDDPVLRRRQSGRSTRWLRLLRAHGLIGKVSGTRYYRVTARGQHVMSTALRLREIDVSRLAA
jgi:hypothetical protein